MPVRRMSRDSKFGRSRPRASSVVRRALPATCSLERFGAHRQSTEMRESSRFAFGKRKHRSLCRPRNDSSNSSVRGRPRMPSEESFDDHARSVLPNACTCAVCIAVVKAVVGSSNLCCIQMLRDWRWGMRCSVWICSRWSGSSKQMLKRSQTHRRKIVSL